MDAKLLIPGILRLSARLVAAVAGQQRTSLANFEAGFRVALADELQRRGISRRVMADMVGESISSLQSKITAARSALTSDSAPNTTRQELLGYIYRATSRVDDSGRLIVSRRHSVPWEALLRVFKTRTRSDEVRLASLVRDLVRTGLLSEERSHGFRHFRLGSKFAEVGADDELVFDALVQVAVMGGAPGVTFAHLTQIGLGPVDRLRASLARLVDSGHIESVGQDYWVCRLYELSFSSSTHWTAAFYDHLEAIVGALTHKVDQAQHVARRDDRVGGSTFRFEVWTGHPYEREVLAKLSEMRRTLSALREAVDEYNEGVGTPPGATRVAIYIGQDVVADGEAS